MSEIYVTKHSEKEILFFTITHQNLLLEQREPKSLQILPSMQVLLQLQVNLQVLLEDHSPFQEGTSKNISMDEKMKYFE